MSLAKAAKSPTRLMAGMAAISISVAVINPTAPPPPVVQAPVALAGIGDPITGAGLLTSETLTGIGGIVSPLLGASLLHLPGVISEQPYALTAYFLRGAINGLTIQVGAILNGEQDIPGGLANILGQISQYGQTLAAIEADLFSEGGGGGLLGAAASPQQLSAKTDSVQTDAALPGLPNLGIGQLVNGAGELAGFALAGVGGILTPLLGIDLHIPAVISDQPYAVTQYFLRGVIDGIAGELGGVIDGQQDIPGAVANILGSISGNFQQLATIEGGIFGQEGLLGAAASPQQLSAKTESVQADAAALPGLPNLGIGQAVNGAGQLAGFALAGVGGILTPLLGIDLHIPAVISDQPYAVTQYFLRPVINYVTSEIGGVIDGQQDIPGGLSTILGAVSQSAQGLAAVEGPIFGGSLLGAAASPQQLSAKTVSIPTAEAKTPDPVSTETDAPEVKSLASKATDDSAPASTGSAAPASSGVSSTVDKGTPATDKDKTPPADVDKTPAADKDKTPAGDPDKTPSGRHRKTPSGEHHETPSGEHDTTSTGRHHKTPSGEHDKG